MRAFDVTHVTTYRYSHPVAVSRHLAYLEPRTKPGRQEADGFGITIEPEPAEIASREDYFGNRQHHFQIQSAHSELRIEARSRVRVAPFQSPDPALTPPLSEVRRRLGEEVRREWLDARFFSYPSAHVPVEEPLARFGAPYLLDERPVFAAVLDLMAAIHREFEFSPGETDVTTPVLEVLRLRRGVCQDFAHLMLAVLRARGLAARYVSGYLLTQPPPGKPRLQGADASHAWVGVFIPGDGWIGIDPTNNLVCSDEHIVVAVGRDYGDVSPVKGAVIGGGEQEIDIEVTVVPEGEVAVAPPKKERPSSD